MLFLIYQFLTGLSEPILEQLLQKRLGQGKEDPARIDERRGKASVKRAAGKLVWLHAASIGESLSALPLLEELKARLPDYNFLITTGTVTSAQLMAQRLPQGVIHQYIPMDHPQWTKNFMDHWHPDMVLWMESELWPNMLHEVEARRIPSALLNARMGPDSQKKWKFAKGLSKKMLRTFDIVLAGARDYIEPFQKMGARRVDFVGNLKFGSSAVPIDSNKLTDLELMIGQRRCLGFVSTHPGEERMAGEIFQELQKQFPDLFIIVAPRKHTRGSEIKTQLKMMGLNAAVRSQNEPITAQTNIYIADTIGEMGLWYSLCPIIVIGGSFIAHGGQNPIEGLHFGSAIFYGPHMFNFPEIATIMENAEAAERVDNPNDLLSALHKTLRYPSVLNVKQEKAYALARQSGNIIEAYTSEILERLVR